MDGGAALRHTGSSCVLQNKFAVLWLFFDVEAWREFDPNRGSVGISGCEHVTMTYANFNGKMTKLSQLGIGTKFKKILLCESNYGDTIDTLDTFSGE